MPASDFGRVRQETPRRLNVEFVSANPTGPLTVGNARGAFVGDLLCRVLEAAGDDVTREYYFNDSGRQVRVLGASVAARKVGDELPEEAYRGAYVDDPGGGAAGRDLGDGHGRRTPTVTQSSGAWASERIRAGIEASLAHLGVHFDVWKSETIAPHGGLGRREPWSGSGPAATSSSRMARPGSARPTFGDDKDRVIYRTTGEPTYFAADIGYVTEKFARGYDKLIYIWGADHHGTVARVRNAAKAMGFDIDAVEMLLVAWVRFVRDGQEVSMSKRAGEFITLDELLAEVGVDAARWSFAARAPSSPIDFDIELARRQSADNPVYYVQYAHARICSILRKAAEAGIAPAATLAGSAHGRRRGRHGPCARGAAPAGGRRGRRGRRGDTRGHGVRHRARDDVPRLLPRPSGGRPRRPGHLGASTGARGHRASRAAQHARPAGHLDPRTDVGPASPPALGSIASDGGRVPPAFSRGVQPPAFSSPTPSAPSTCWRVSPLLATRTSTGVVQAARDVGTGKHHVGAIEIGHRSVDCGAELVRVRAAVPGRLPDHGPGTVGPLEADEAVAAPAISSGRSGRGRVTAIRQQDADVQLTHRLGIAGTPAVAQRGRHVGQAHLDRRVRRIALGVQDLLRRCRQLVAGGVHAGPAALAQERAHEHLALEIGELQLSTQELGGIPSRSCCWAGVIADVSCERSSGLRFWAAHWSIRRRRVALDEGQSGERPVAL